MENPGDDLTSALIAAREEDGDRLSQHELIGTLLLMIIAGHETTLNLITNAVRALCAHRDQLELVQSGKASWSDVVEETLRWDSPVSYFPFRYPTRDLTLDGTVIPKGTPVLAGYSAAGRDPAAHGPDADRFDITRTGGRPASLAGPRPALLPGLAAGADGGDDRAGAAVHPLPGAGPGGPGGASCRGTRASWATACRSCRYGPRA